MTTFYDDWLQHCDEAERERQQARRNLHEEQLEWVETAQDHRIALLVSPETGFRTWGTSTMLTEIPRRAKSVPVSVDGMGPEGSRSARG